MKNVLFLCVLSVFCNVFAADPAFQGSFLAALEERDPQARVSKIIEALEVSSAPLCDANAIKILEEEQSKGNISTSCSRRLFDLAKKKPADFVLARLCMLKAAENYPFPAELLDTVDKNICSADLTELEKQQYNAAVTVINFYNFHRMFRKEYTAVLKLNEKLFTAYPDNFEMMELIIISTIHCCFANNFTTPQMDSFAGLPETDVYRKLLTAAGKKLLSMPVKSDIDAAIMVNCAALLKLPETPELLKKYAKLYPEYQWRRVSTSVAKTFNLPQLLILENDFFYDFQSRLICKDFAGAQKMIDSIAGNIKETVTLELQIMLWTASGEFCMVNNLVNSGRLKLNALAFPSMTRSNICHAAQMQNDKVLARQLLLIIEKESLDPKKFAPDMCNSAGYLCADFSLELPKAEKLIRMAVKTDPYNSAYRDSLAWVLFKQGRFAEAEKEIQLALDFSFASSSVSVLMLHAAEIKTALKKYDEAKILLSTAMRLYDPEDINSAEYDLKAEKRLMRVLK